MLHDLKPYQSSYFIPFLHPSNREWRLKCCHQATFKLSMLPFPIQQVFHLYCALVVSYLCVSSTSKATQVQFWCCSRKMLWICCMKMYWGSGEWVSQISSFGIVEIISRSSFLFQNVIFDVRCYCMVFVTFRMVFW